MATHEEYFIAKAITEISLNCGFDIILKPKQAVNDLLAGKDVFAVLPTGFGKSLIFQAFVKAKKTLALSKPVTVLVLSPLVSIINDQLEEMKSLGISAADLSVLSDTEIRESAFQILYASAEQVEKAMFRNALKDCSTKLHHNITAIVVDESHTVETWTGLRLVLS